MKKITLITVIAIIAIAGCKKKPDSRPQPPLPIDVYEMFKADATPRWENGSTVVKNEDNIELIFVTDSESALFESSNFKIGYMKDDGSDYEMIEFSGTPVVGTPTGAIIRKPAGTTAIYSLEIVKIEGSKLWIVFKETANSTERKVVQ